MRSSELIPIENGLTLNFLKMVFNKDTLFLRKTLYSDELYNEYKLNPDFFIYRIKDNLYIWELHPTNQQLPRVFEQVEITIKEYPRIFSKIAERAIVQFFRNNNRQTTWNKYSSIWEVELKKEKQENFNALSLQPTLRFSVIDLYSTLSQRQVIALSIRRRMKPFFTESEESIMNQLTDNSELTRNYRGEINASTHNLNKYLEATGQKKDYRSYLGKRQTRLTEFEFLKTSAKNFNHIAPDIYMPDGLKISKFSIINPTIAFFKTAKIPKPKYCYYNERTMAGYYNEAVSKSKPYSYDLFSNQKVNILVVSPDKYDRSIREHIKTLDRKLQTLFHLKDVKFHLKIIKSPETYLDVLDKIDANNYNLAIIVVSQQDKEMCTSQSPYYLTKAKLLNQRLPTQELTIEVIRNSSEIIDNDIALNIYSKLGGVAWTIEKSEKNISELVIGIGSTIDDCGERIIGFASVFDYNGTYLIGDCSQLSTMNKYTENLENYLVNALTQAFHQKGLSKGDEVRLIFHLFKEAGKRHELTAIGNALRRFKGYDVEYSLVHLSTYGHNYRIFKNQGRSSPNRGTFVQLSSQQALLHLGGNTVVPIQVRLDNRSKYTDIFEITQQVLYFAHLSYRSFIHGGQPVTIKYPNLMANMVSELKKVPNWDHSILNKLNETLWFI